MLIRSMKCFSMLFPRTIKRGKNDKIGALDPLTGKLYTSPQDDENLLTVVYSDKFDA